MDQDYHSMEHKHKEEESPAAVERFSDLPLRPDVLTALNALGFDKTFPVQSKGLPHSLAGRDVVAQAQTGTGKTAVFGIPIIQRIDLSSRKLQALIIVPTRELAMQVAEEIRSYTIEPLRIAPIFGGVSIENQISQLRAGLQVAVGTPGRLMDHMERRTIDLSSVRILVLDEVDRMLDMGFIDDIEFIVSHVPKDRHTMIFSATIPPKIRELAARYLRDPVDVSVRIGGAAAEKVKQLYVDAKEWNKFVLLREIFSTHSVGTAMVFCRTKFKAQRVGQNLQHAGFHALSIHGDLTQAQRTSTLEMFREGRLKILVATDVAARGLDIDGVTHVINYDLPEDVDSYVHRVGRTARAGKEGIAISFVTHEDHPVFRKIMDVMTGNVEKLEVPLPPGVGDRAPVGWTEGAPPRGRGGGRRSGRGAPGGGRGAGVQHGRSGFRRRH